MSTQVMRTVFPGGKMPPATAGREARRYFSNRLLTHNLDACARVQAGTRLHGVTIPFIIGKGDHTIPVGGSLALRYRFYFNIGDEKAAKIAGHYADSAAGK